MKIGFDQVVPLFYSLCQSKYLYFRNLNLLLQGIVLYLRIELLRINISGIQIVIWNYFIDVFECVCIGGVEMDLRVVDAAFKFLKGSGFA